MPASSRTKTVLSSSRSLPSFQRSSHDAKRAGADAGFLLQALGRLAGQRAADDPIAGSFPGLARGLHHGGLAGAGAPDHGRDPRAAGDMLDRRPLLIGQPVMAREHRRQHLLPNAMRGPLPTARSRD